MRAGLLHKAAKRLDNTNELPMKLSLRVIMIQFRIAATLVLAAACGGQIPVSPQDSGSVFDPDGGRVDSQSRAYVRATVQAGTDEHVNDATACGLSSALRLDVGAQGATVADGSVTYPKGTLLLDCRVAPLASNSAFAVHLSIGIADQPDGTASKTFDVKGTIAASAPGIARVDFRPDRTAFSYGQNDCSLSYPDNVQPPIASGRIWALLDCPRFSDGVNSTCRLQAEIKFENCASD